MLLAFIYIPYIKKYRATRCIETIGELVILISDVLQTQANMDQFTK
jgi:hypothetical protein